MDGKYSNGFEVVYNNLLFSVSKDLTAKNIEIYPKDETEPVFSPGDAADDPAFWFNKKDPQEV